MLILQNPYLLFESSVFGEKFQHFKNIIIFTLNLLHDRALDIVYINIKTGKTSTYPGLWNMTQDKI
jgi:hypothetical protein